MVAIQTDSGFAAAVSNAPLFFDNFCTQAFYPDRGQVHLNSEITACNPENKPEGGCQTALFLCNSLCSTPFRCAEPATPRLGIIPSSTGRPVGGCRSLGGIKDRYGAIAFASNYLHLRSDELGFSRAVVVPGIHYSNYQYSRDAFWQSMILPPELAAECYRHVGMRRELRAEIPLLFLIWSWRSVMSGVEIDSDLLQPISNILNLILWTAPIERQTIR
jgi:hypothetical protein